MKPRKIEQKIFWVGAIDWNRRLFDSLIPLPEGTSYNSYLIQGDNKTALLDTVDATKTNILLSQLYDIPKIDFLISHHAEQDQQHRARAEPDCLPDADLSKCLQCASSLLTVCLKLQSFLK